MRLIATFTFFLLSTVSFAQTKALSTLPSYDCSLKKIMAIIGRQTIITSPDNSIGLDAILADYCSTFGNNCIRKKESALTDSDYAKDILMVGILSDFKKWTQLKTSITRIANGFIINNKIFKDRSDGFVYVDTNRIIIGGNSLKAVKDAQLALTGGHDIVIVQNGKITWFGNKKDNTHFNWFNLQGLKESNYYKKSSELFSAIFISKTFKDTIDYPKLNKALKSYTQQFLSIYKLKMPTKKISWFLHSNMNEYGTMSGMFGLTCPGNNSAGFSIRGEIHTNGFDTGLVKHEYSHFLFDNAIPQDNNPAFFVEGCVEYVTNLNDKDLYNKRLKVARKFRDTLNYADLIINNRDFYGQYSSENYSICGVFVKYIIDKFGVEAFKAYCLADNRKVKTKDIFKIDFDTLVDNYKVWLDMQ
ncbi:hypothetical protein GFS24_02350 [Chitinophaga sp. SYP-B3965]|uniref:hypothetical protein n=1 Tax=Chitinophaga sp. SYP-B3965 TaxID=2663120 RepID=UPI00129964CB|nr:hypothetical protein [Chitinophaga sp. SYP-B3965]MRG43933.1 hypothetical protein [Chitinophaga sp. SYP-B3965]